MGKDQSRCCLLFVRSVW
uniref:Uncharacterized protein n=1 Tax=Arundo donax TaxID=35708 RepID=A0A0A9HCX7_ARUDO